MISGGEKEALSREEGERGTVALQKHQSSGDKREREIGLFVPGKSKLFKAVYKKTQSENPFDQAFRGGRSPAGVWWGAKPEQRRKKGSHNNMKGELHVRSSLPHPTPKPSSGEAHGFLPSKFELKEHRKTPFPSKKVGTTEKGWFLHEKKTETVEGGNRKKLKTPTPEEKTQDSRAWKRRKSILPPDRSLKPRHGRGKGFY